MKKAFLFLLLNITFFGIAQKNIEFIPENFPNQEKALNSAIRDIQDGDYYANNAKISLSYYMKAAKFNPNNAKLLGKIGKCHLEVQPKSRSIDYFRKAIAIDSSMEKELLFYLARAFHLTNNFDSAIYYYKAYLKGVETIEFKQKSGEISRLIYECENAKEFFEKPTRVIIYNMGEAVNSEFSDYGPVVSTDESALFFTSRRSDTYKGGEDELDFDYYEDVYHTERINYKWQKCENIGQPINSSFHDAVIGLSPSGQTMLLYKGSNGGDIFISKLDGLQWTTPIPFGKEINSKYKEPSASLAYDNKTIFFVSDRPGGYGGKDIYSCVLDENGNIGQLKNLGATINTAYDELSVFIHPDGKTLYFSSNGHKSMGGYDIFKSVFENGKWSEPENLGFPINSPDNDVFFTISASGQNAYYSSSKEGGLGGQDIYRIYFLGEEKLTISNTEDNMLASKTESVGESITEEYIPLKTNHLTLIKGVVLDAATLKPIKAKIELIDNSKNEVVAVFESNKSSGKYLITLPSGKNYGISVSAEGYLFHSENFDIPATAVYREVEKRILLQRPIIGSEIKLNNIFFETAKSDLGKESIFELTKLYQLLLDYPSIQIEISGHTDNIGTEEFNVDLSTKRAKAVVDFLVSKGISSNRLIFKGYGFSRPIATNDTEDGRKQNRRSEIKILDQ